MASTTSPRVSRVDEGSARSRRPGDGTIVSQRQPTSKRIVTVTDPRSEEARRRSEAVQAAIDIAAGW